MKKLIIVIATLSFLLVGNSGVMATSSCEGVGPDTNIWWGKLKLRDGQIGKVTVKQAINLWTRENNKLVFSRILQPGEEYSVYRYDEKFGGQYGLGANLWVTKNPVNITYTTPSKKKIERLACKQQAQNGRTGANHPSVITKEKGLYAVLLDTIQNVKDKVTIQSLAIKTNDRAILDEQFSKNFIELSKTLEQINAENPEIFYYRGTHYKSNGELTFTYSHTPSDVQKMRQELDTKIKAIIESIDTNLSNYEKVKKVHDYIVLTSEYDYQNLLSNTLPSESYSIYGVLVKNVAVCDGYSKTMNLLLSKLGIEAKYISGMGDGIPHSWNLVKLDGQWYHVDATWNDPVPDRKGMVRYDYFLVSDEVMEETHVWKKASFPTAAKNYTHK
ncbi:hypothetical protein IMZ08_03415 [Bacillus luteolus]|uniref:Transglutaminase-like domain-containing protein n=1 Tax=Litchfieldia luteola TaxID=682179 RepID=A0ABR9QF28_9BACI|nr:transglutaminase domain-containing protein [Cytobacillus luteolus]MBE4907106.1 hypothetical protein [Cytobacillus luteolus]MBP1943425.1 hypothetical protein [Cytobacillus luteolus]